MAQQNPEWTAYEAAMVQWRLDLAAWQKNEGVAVEQQAARAAQVVALQAKATSLTDQIARKAEQVWTTEMIDLANITVALEAGFGGVGELYNGIDSAPEPVPTFYVATFTTDWGEESAPSPPSAMVEPSQYDRVDIAAPAFPSGRFITHVNIYRSNSGAESAPFQFVLSRPVTDTGPIADALKSAQLGEVLPSTTWLEPPANLRGLVGVPNGILAGFFDNTLCFSDPYHPYAWPLEYQITTEFQIVGLAVFGQTIFVGTTGNPYLVSGSDSASMSALKMESSQACVSKRSIVPVQGGVLYASPDGLCLASGNGVQVVTGGIFTREEWQALSPHTIRAAESEGVYYMAHSGARAGTYAFDLPTRKLIAVDLQAGAFFVDRQSDALFAAVGGSVVHVFGSNQHRLARWRSGRSAIPEHATLAWLQAQLGHRTDLDSPVYVRLRGDGWRIGMHGDLLKERADGTLLRANDAALFAYEGASIRNITTGALYAPGSAEHDRIHCTAKVTGNEPLRLPPGRWREYEFEIESRQRVTRITLAGSTKELQATP